MEPEELENFNCISRASYQDDYLHISNSLENVSTTGIFIGSYTASTFNTDRISTFDIGIDPIWKLVFDKQLDLSLKKDPLEGENVFDIL